ncbi:MAG: hypothetical protein OXE99_04530 [Cellvibrionales bacterium]|nr:hypothetical protein [Cellvibrionales bacterium]
MKKNVFLAFLVFIGFSHQSSFSVAAILPSALKAISMTNTALDTSDKFYRLNKNTGTPEEEIQRKFKYALLIGTGVVFTGLVAAYAWDLRNEYVDRKQQQIDKEAAAAEKAQAKKDLREYRTLKLYQLQKNANPKHYNEEAERAIQKRFGEMKPTPISRTM